MSIDNCVERTEASKQRLSSSDERGIRTLHYIHDTAGARVWLHDDVMTRPEVTSQQTRTTTQCYYTGHSNNFSSAKQSRGVMKQLRWTTVTLYSTVQVLRV